MSQKKFARCVLYPGNAGQISVTLRRILSGKCRGVIGRIDLVDQITQFIFVVLKCVRLYSCGQLRGTVLYINNIVGAIHYFCGRGQLK